MACLLVVESSGRVGRRFAVAFASTVRGGPSPWRGLFWASSWRWSRSRPGTSTGRDGVDEGW